MMAFLSSQESYFGALKSRLHVLLYSPAILSTIKTFLSGQETIIKYIRCILVQMLKTYALMLLKTNIY